MPARAFVLVVMVDLLAVLAVAGFVVRVLRGGRTSSGPVPREGVLLAAVAAVLLLAALPLPWVRATGNGRGLATLTDSPASSMVGLVALVLSIAALGMGADLGLRSSTLVVPLTGVILGAGWCLVALNNLLLIAGVNRAAVGGGHLSAGPAVWLCLLGGLVAVAAGEIAARGSALLAPTPPAVPPARTNVDEWGMPGRPARTNVYESGTAGLPTANDIGDQW